MACNRESSDGASPAPPPPAPATPGSCPSPDVIVPCCNNNCHFSGCAATVNLCPKCSTERLCKEESAFNACSKQKVDLAAESAAMVGMAAECNVTARNCPPTEDVKDVTGMGRAPVMADIADLRTVMKSKSSSSRSMILPTQPPGSCKIQEQRIPSPLSLSPSQQGEVGMSLTPLPRDRAINRCVACHKRVGLIGFKCRCGDLFCASHRYSDKHECSFDYKAAGRLAIAKENPVVMASKINKI